MEKQIKQLIISLFIITGLNSCEIDYYNKAYITNYKYYEDRNCIYTIQFIHWEGGVPISAQITFIDSCGKFQIDDTLYLRK